MTDIFDENLRDHFQIVPGFDGFIQALGLILALVLFHNVVKGQNGLLEIPDVLYPVCDLTEGESITLNANTSNSTKDKTVFILADANGVILIIKDNAQLTPPSKGLFLAYSLTHKIDGNIVNLEVGKHLDDISIDDESCLSWSNYVTIGICPQAGETCDFLVGEHITFMVENGNYDASSDSLLYLLVNQNNFILDINTNSLFPSLSNGGLHFVYSLVFEKHFSDVQNLQIGSAMDELVITGCYDWNIPLILDICNCSVDTVFVADSICYNEFYSFNGSELNQSGQYSETFNDQHGCDSTVVLDLAVLGRDTVYLFDRICYGDSVLFDGVYIKEEGIYLKSATDHYGCAQTIRFELKVIPNSAIVFTMDFDQCTFELGEEFSLGISGGSLTEGDTTIYILTNEEGEILLINTLPTYIINTTGNYQAFALSYDKSAELDGLKVGQNISNLEICGCADLTSFGFEICESFCPTQVEFASSFEECDVEVADEFTLGTIGGDLDLGDTTVYVLTKQDGKILKINSVPTYSIQTTGNYQVFAISYDKSLIINGLNVEENIFNLETCGCADISQGFGFEICDTSCEDKFTSIQEEICFGESHFFNNTEITQSGIYLDTLTTVNGCDSTITLNLTVLGRFIPAELPVSFDSCATTPTSTLILSKTVGNTTSADSTIYVLTNQNGMIQSVKNRPEYFGLTVGKYAVYALAYTHDAPPVGLFPGEKIIDIGSCGCMDIGPPYGFEVCGECETLDVNPPISYEQCAFATGVEFELGISSGNKSSRDSTAYIISDQNGMVVAWSFSPQFNISSVGNYQAYAFSYRNDAIINGLEVGKSIYAISICGRGDLGDGYGFEICDNYDLALKYNFSYVKHDGHFFLYSEVPATIKVINQGNASVGEIGLVTYVPDGLSLSPNENLWTLSSDDRAMTTLNSSLAPGDSIDVEILLRITGSAYDLLLDEIVGTAEIAYMKNENLVIVLDEDSTPDTIRTNDNGDVNTTDNWCDDDGTIDEDDHDFLKVVLRYIDPTGFIYCEKSGDLVTGGHIVVTGPGNVRILKDGSDGSYQYLVDSTGIYTVTVMHPAGYPISTSCNVQSDILFVGNRDGDPTIDLDGIVNDTIVTGSGLQNGVLEDNTCGGNPFYANLYFDAYGPAMIVNNNIPVSCIIVASFVCMNEDGEQVDSGADGVEVELYKCQDTINEVSSQFTYDGGNYSFRDIDEPGCYKLRFIETDQFKVIPNDLVDGEGWSTEIQLDWGVCDSSIVVCVGHIFDLSLDKEVINGNGSFLVGDTVEYNVVVRNNGNIEAKNVRIVDLIPDSMSIVRGDFSALGSDSAVAYVDILPPETSDTLLISFRISPRFKGEVIRNCAEIMSSENDFGLQDEDSTEGNGDENENDYNCETIDVGYHDLALRKKLAPGSSGPFKPFDEVPFIITVFNQGNIPIMDVEIYEHFQNGMKLSPNDQHWTSLNDSIAKYVITSAIAPGDSVQVPVLTNVTLRTVALGLKELVNIAEVASARDSSGQEIDDIDSTPDTDAHNDIGGMSGDNTDDEINDDGTMDEDDQDPEMIEIDELDPAGFIYCDKTGQVLTGGTITVSGPGQATILKDGSDGSYQYFVDVPGDYTLSYIHPAGFPLSQKCLAIPGVFDPSNKEGDPNFDKDGIANNVLVMGSDAANGVVIDNSCDATPYFLSITINPDAPPLITNNNIPISCIVIGSIVCQKEDTLTVQNGSEPGLEGIEVSLYECADTILPIDVTYTDANGIYSFTDIVQPGCYRVKFTETAEFQVIPNNLVDLDGWSDDIVVDWGTCDSTVTVCFTVCAIDPPISQGDQVICLGGIIPPLNANVPNGQTVDWYDAVTGGNLLQSGNETYLPTATGTYYAEARKSDSDCVSSIRTAATVLAHPALTCLVIPSDPACSGESGSIEIRSFGSTSTYDISWGEQSSSDVFNANSVSAIYTIYSLSTGAWSITVTDENDCTSTCATTISAPAELSCGTTISTHPSCAGASNGSININANGGIPPYVYTINGNSNTTGLFTGLVDGTYSVLVEDNNFCSSICTVTLTDLPQLSCTVDINSQPACEGNTRGEITALADGGTFPYTYRLSGQENNSGNFENLEVGFYSLVVEDGNGCTSLCLVTLENSDSELTCTVSITSELTCESANNAVILVQGFGGNPPYNYALDSQINTNGIFTGLSSGLWAVSVTDADNCLSVCTVEIEAQDDLSCSIDIISEPTCSNYNGGEIRVNTTGTGTSHTYSLNNQPTQPLRIFSGLQPGHHFVVVSDENGCTSSCIATLDEPEDLFCVIGNIISIDCPGGSNGSFSVAVFQGQTPYEYSLNNGSFQQEIFFQNLGSDIYTVAVRDNNGCESSCQVELSEPLPLICQVETLTGPVCSGVPTAQIKVTGTGGTGPYQYRATGGTFSTDSIIKQLAPGDYTIEILDSRGCVSECIHTISDVSNVVCNILFIENAICDESNGSVILKATGGIGQYTYHLNDATNSDGIFDGLGPGFYQLVVSDENSCTSLCSFEIGSKGVQVPDVTCTRSFLDIGCNPGHITEAQELIDNNIVNASQGTTVAHISTSEDDDGCIRRRLYSFISINDCGVTSEDTCEVVLAWTIDHEVPLIEGIPNDTAILDATEVPEMPIVIVSDNCADVTLEFSERQIDQECGFNLVREWSAIDDCGNMAIRVQNIHVENCDKDSVDLKLTKAVSKLTPKVGERITYAIEVINKGPGNATNVEVIDYLPSGVETVKEVTEADVSQNDFIWKNLNIPADSSIFLSFTAEVSAPRISITYKNIAEIITADQPDIDSDYANDNGDQSEDDAVTIFPDDGGNLPGSGQIDLELEKTVSDTNPLIKDVITYSITIRNTGDSTATGIDVIDYLPVDYCVDFSNISHSGSRQGDQIIWSNLALEPEEEITLTFNTTFAAKANGQIVENTAEIVAHDQNDKDSGPDNQKAEEDDQDGAVFKVGRVSDLSLAKKIMNSEVATGDTVTFEITLHNDGPDRLDFAEVEDIVPDGYTDIHNISHNGINFADRIIWYAYDLSVGEEIKFTFDTRLVHFPDQVCDYRNIAQIMQSSNGDPDSSPGNDDGNQSEDDEDYTDPFEEYEGDTICAYIDAQVLLEGAYIYREGKMHTELNNLGYLPGQDPITFFGTPTDAGQPYRGQPWSYPGDEGIHLDYKLPGMDEYAGYPRNTTDYVLVSLRLEESVLSTICKRAALVMEDGQIVFFSGYDCCEVDGNRNYYIVVQHRNHLPVMSHVKVPVTNGTLSYDFRFQNSYIGALGLGQKEVDYGRFAMYAGNGDQTISTSSAIDINVKDMSKWLEDDGRNSSYYLRDYDLNGDVNVQDKGLFLRNNGVFSDVELN